MAAPSTLDERKRRFARRLGWAFCEARGSAAGATFGRTDRINFLRGDSTIGRTALLETDSRLLGFGGLG